MYRSALANTQTGELYLSLAEDAVRQSVCKSYYDMVNAYEMIEFRAKRAASAKAYDTVVINMTGMITNRSNDALNKPQEAHQ